MKSIDNRQVQHPGPRGHDVAEHCRKHGINATEERKLLQLLGKHAPAHEIRANAAQRPPKFR